MELCQTPPCGALSQQLQFYSQSQSDSHSQSQSYYSSQSVGEQLTSKIKRSRSILSARSLFSSGYQDEGSDESDEESGLMNPEEVGERSFEKDDKIDDELDDELDDPVQADNTYSGEDMFIAMETELNSSNFYSPSVKLASEVEHQRTPQRAVLSKVDQETQKGSGSRTTTMFRSPKSPLKHRPDTDEESEVELPISTPLASPIPPSPKSKELQSDILKELDSFGSDEVGRELDKLGISDSQYDTTYDEVSTSYPSSRYNTYSKTHPELDKVWNSAIRESSSDTQSPLKLGAEAGSATRPSEHNIQLEYEMPEITASQLETSSDPLFNPLDTDSPRTSLTKGHQSSVRLSSSKAKRQLLRKPTGGRGASGRKPETSSVANRTRSKSKNIPQLDGADNVSSSSSSHKTPRKRKRTLGMRRRRTKQLKKDVQPEMECRPPEQVESCRDVEVKSSVPTCLMYEDQQMTTDSDTQEEEGGASPPDRVDAPSSEKDGGMADKVSQEEDGSSHKVEFQNDLMEEDLHMHMDTQGEEGSSNNIEVQDGTHRDTSGKQGETNGAEIESQHPREKPRPSLSLKKSVKRTCRTRDLSVNQKVVETVCTNPNRWKDSDRLKSLALKCALELRLSRVQVNWPKGNTGAAGNQTQKNELEPASIEPSQKKQKKSVIPSSSGCMTRSQRRSRRQRWSPMLVERMSFEQQLKKAIKESKQTYLAESACGGAEGPSGRREESGSPLMFSPPSSDDLNRTVVEESPLGDIGNVNEYNDQAAASDGENEWKLDLSICSISESPPYTSSPQEAREEKLVHDSAMKLQLETSITEFESPPQSSSPLVAGPPTNMDSSFLSDDEFPFITLPCKPTTSETSTDINADVIDSPTKPSTVEMEAASNSLQRTLVSLSQEGLPLPVLPPSPNSLESQSEVDQLNLSRADMSTDSEDDGSVDFHLTLSSESEEEVLCLDGEGSSDCLNFSTEKTSMAVRFAPYTCISSKEKSMSQDHSVSTEPSIRETEGATTGVSVVSGDSSKSSYIYIQPVLAPPTQRELAESASAYNLPSARHKQPFCSCPADVQRPL